MLPIYLDNAASTRVSDEVLAVMTEVMKTAWGNPSSAHPQGASARGHIETARTKLLAALGDKVNALTVSMDLPFAMNRFCGAESIKNMRVGSDYQDRNFGKSYGMLIEELKLLARGTFVLDANGKVLHAETVPEVTSEPNYEGAITALKGAL